MDPFITYKEKPFTVNGVEMPIHCETRETNNEIHLAYTHYHEYIELLYGIDCNTTITLNTQNYPFNSGDLLVIFPNEIHSMYALKPYNKYRVIKFVPAVLQWNGQHNPMESKYLTPIYKNENSEYKRYFPEKEIKSTEIPNILSSIIKEWNEQNYGYELLLHARILDLYLWLTRKWQTDNKQKQKTPALPENLSAAMSMACKYIQANYNTATASELCKKTNYSYSYFLNNFKLFSGYSFTEYLLNIRLLNAANLLLSTDKPVTEIALETGFSTTSYFIFNFKKKYHMSPSVYRKSKNRNFDLKNSTVDFESAT